MKLAIIDTLDVDDVKSFSKVDQRTYQACVPALFKNVKLDNFEVLRRFVKDVPRNYCSHIEELEVNTQSKNTTGNVPPRDRADALVAMLSASLRIHKLVLIVGGSLDKGVISPFPSLLNLKQLSISNAGDEKRTPLSERLVVSIALSTQNLEELSLDRITRSRVHAPELDGVYPFIPLSVNDEDIPNHSVFGSELSLPSLLQIPTLRKLTIRDTHLGDERWTTAPILCRLEFLDLGSCYLEDETFNTCCTERIMAAVGPTVDEFSLTAAVSNALFSEPSVTPLRKLRKLHISPFFPVESVVETMSNLAGSPVEGISVQCFEDDVVDICSELEKFLNLRVERGCDFYHKLKRIDISVTALDDTRTFTEQETDERIAAARRLQAYCDDLQLASIVDKLNAEGSALSGPKSKDSRRARSMTL